MTSEKQIEHSCLPNLSLQVSKVLTCASVVRPAGIVPRPGRRGLRRTFDEKGRTAGRKKEKVAYVLVRPKTEDPPLLSLERGRYY